jgi:hypothetical protein
MDHETLSAIIAEAMTRIEGRSVIAEVYRAVDGNDYVVMIGEGDKEAKRWLLPPETWDDFARSEEHGREGNPPTLAFLAPASDAPPFEG